MTDTVKSWIKERRGIHAKATPGKWWWEGESDESWPQSENSLMAGEKAIVMGWGYDASGIDVEDNDANYITDALNTHPAALNALEQVLGLHVKGYETAGAYWCSECETRWPCSTVQAIEGAINE